MFHSSCVVAPQPPSLLSLAHFVTQNREVIYGDSAVSRAITGGNTAALTSHMTATQRLSERFFNTLRNHPSSNISTLADMVEDPETGLQVYRFYLLIGGNPTQAKKILLNAVLKLFAMYLRRKDYDDKDIDTLDDVELAKSELQSTTLSTYFKRLFAEFKRNGILITQADFTNFKDSYSSDLSNRMANAAGCSFGEIAQKAFALRGLQSGAYHDINNVQR